MSEIKLIAPHLDSMTVIRFLTACPRQERTGYPSFRRLFLSGFFLCACHIQIRTDKKRNLYLPYNIENFSAYQLCSGMQQGLQSNRCNGIEDSVFYKVIKSIISSYTKYVNASLLPFFEAHCFYLRHFIRQHTHLVIERNACHDNVHPFRFEHK